MNQEEYINVPEIQEVEASSQLSDLYLKISEGDIEKNIRAISSAITTKYLESLSAMAEVNQSLASDSERNAASTRRRYSGIPKLLVEGVEHQGQQIKPSEAWLQAQAIKNKTYEEAINILDSYPQADILNLMIDTIKKIDLKKSEEGESPRFAFSTAKSIAGTELKRQEFKDIIDEIEILMKQRKEEVLKNERDKAERQSPRELDHTITYMATRCIDYAMLTYPARVLKRMEPRLKSKVGKDVLASLVSEFSSLGYAEMSSIYHDEHPDFMDDVANILTQSSSLDVSDLNHIRGILELRYKK